MLTLAGHLLTVVLTLKSLGINNVDIVDTFPRIHASSYYRLDLHLYSMATVLRPRQIKLCQLGRCQLALFFASLPPTIMIAISKNLKYKYLKYLLWLPALAILSMRAFAGDSSQNLEQQFQTPPRTAHLWVYWVWLDSDIPPAALTRDLEEMKAKGIAGCILYGNQSGSWSWKSKVVRNGNEYRSVRTGDYKDSYITPMPGEPLVTWSPHWRKLVCFAAGEAGRLGIDFVVADGLANTSGRISEEYGEQKLVWTETSVPGSQTYDGLARTIRRPTAQNGIFIGT